MALIINGITLESSRIPATGTLQNEADLNAEAQRKTLYENIRAYNRLFSGINKISSMYTLLESI